MQFVTEEIRLKQPLVLEFTTAQGSLSKIKFIEDAALDAERVVRKVSVSHGGCSTVLHKTR